MTTPIAQEPATDGPYDVIGTRPIRHDGLDKVTGRAKYGADIQPPGVIHGKLLRSPHAHARIRGIDTSKAEALPGVLAVATSRDFPVLESGGIDFADAQAAIRMLAANILASGKVLYVGHAVAAVGATSAAIAEEAAGLIEVDYEPLPPVLTIADAMKDDAPLLHDNMTTRFRIERMGVGDDTGVSSNVAAHVQFRGGDIEAGFQEAAVVVEREFATQTVHQGYIEPHTSTADWSRDGRLTVWTSTQAAFGVRDSTAAIVGLPESRVKVVPMEIGGGFGAKLTTYLAPVAAILSRKSGRPVKMVMTRKEVFEGTGPGSATVLRCKMGVDGAGRIMAATVSLAFEAGAFPGSPMAGGAMTALGPYVVENFLVDGYDVVCNKQKVQAYRAPGQPQGAFVVECVIDELAERLGMDPMELRLKNVVREGDRMVTGVPHPRIGLEEVEKAMKSHPHYSAPLGGPNRGRGVAVGFRLNAGIPASATMNVNSDGTISLVSGSVDIGGGRAAIAMQAAEALGLPAEAVTPTVVDTDSIGFTGVTGGSRTTFDTGLAAIAAAREVKQKMAARAAVLWEVQPEDVQFQGGVFVCTKNPSDRMTFAELAGKLMATGGPVTCSASVPSPGAGPAFAGNIVDVEVDPETGKVDVLRYTALEDVGRAVHPSYVEGQMQGASVQGIGWALTEEYVYAEDGSVANPTFLDYRMPTTLDTPMIDTVLIEVPNPRHPYGLRGVGEPPIVPPLPAIANAVSHAIGVRMTRLPLSPAVVLAALQGKEAQQH